MSYGRERLHPNILIDDYMHRQRAMNDLIKNPHKYRKDLSEEEPTWTPNKSEKTEDRLK